MSLARIGPQITSKPHPLFTLRARNAGSRQLGQDEFSMGNDLFQIIPFCLTDHFFTGKILFPGRTPDIDAPGVQHQQPGVQAPQLLAKGIKTQLVIGRNQDDGIRIGMAHGIYPR